MNDFKAVIGHEAIIRSMRYAIETARVGHAYILDGAKGMGKKTLAKAFAKTLQCETGLSDACGVCLSCRVFDSGNHPDVLYVRNTKRKSVGVDDVREQLLHPMSERPFRYRYKIFIVEEADTLTPAAQNALLKTIEEPASYGIFILLAAHTHLFLPTVLSRCVTFKLHPLPETQVQQALRDKNMPEEQARLCAAFSRGNIGEALMLAESEDFTALRRLALEVVSDLHTLDIAGTMSLYHKLEKWKESIQSLLDMLYLCARDLMVLKETGDFKQLIQQDFAEALSAIAKTMPPQTPYRYAEALAQAKQFLRQNGNFQMTLEWMLLRMNGREIV